MKISWGDLRMLVAYGDKENIPDTESCDIQYSDEPVGAIAFGFEDEEGRACSIVIRSMFLKLPVRLTKSMDLHTRLEKKEDSDE